MSQKCGWVLVVLLACCATDVQGSTGCSTGTFASVNPASDAVVAYNPANEVFDGSRTEDLGSASFDIATNGFTAVLKVKFADGTAWPRLFSFGNPGTHTNNNILLGRSVGNNQLYARIDDGVTTKCDAHLGYFDAEQTWLPIYMRYHTSQGLSVTILDQTNAQNSAAPVACTVLNDRTVPSTKIGKSQVASENTFKGEIAGLYAFNRYLSDAEAEAVLATIQTGALDDPLHTACQACPAGLTTLAAGAESADACVCQTGAWAPFTPADAVVAFNPANEVFDGSSRFQNLGAVYIDYSQGITVVAKVDFGSAVAWERVVSLNHGVGVTDQKIAMYRNNNAGTMYFALWDSTGTSCAFHFGSLGSGSVHHIIARYHPQHGLDAIFDGSQSGPSSCALSFTADTFSDTFIGKSEVDSSPPRGLFSGQIAGLYAFNRYLSDAEAKAALATIQTGALDDPLHTACQACPAGSTTLAAGAESADACVCQVASYKSPVLLSGLRALYRLDGNTSDSSGNGYDLTMTNAAADPYSEMGVNALHPALKIKDSTTVLEYAASASAGHLWDNIVGGKPVTTLAVWLKDMDLSANIHGLFSLTWANGLWFRLDLYATGKLGLTFYGGGWDARSFYPTCATAVDWNARAGWWHVVFTSDGTNIKMRYRNQADSAYTTCDLRHHINTGTSITTWYATRTIDPASLQTWKFESMTPNIKLDDARVYNRALFDSEINELFNEKNPCKSCPAGLTTLASGAESIDACVCPLGQYFKPDFTEAITISRAQTNCAATHTHVPEGHYTSGAPACYFEHSLHSEYTMVEVTFGISCEVGNACGPVFLQLDDGTGVFADVAQTSSGGVTELVKKTFSYRAGSKIRIEERLSIIHPSAQFRYFFACEACPAGSTTLAAGAESIEACVCSTGTFASATYHQADTADSSWQAQHDYAIANGGRLLTKDEAIAHCSAVSYDIKEWIPVTRTDGQQDYVGCRDWTTTTSRGKSHCDDYGGCPTWNVDQTIAYSFVLYLKKTCTSCPAGSTTLAAGAESADACVCQSGSFDMANSVPLGTRLKAHYRFDSDLQDETGLTGALTGNGGLTYTDSPAHIGARAIYTKSVGPVTATIPVSLATLVGYTDGFSISFWFKSDPAKSPKATHAALFSFNSASSQGFIAYLDSDNDVWFRYYPTSGAKLDYLHATNSVDFHDSVTWRHLTFSLAKVSDTEHTVRFFVDGSEMTADQASTTIGLTSTANTGVIGSNNAKATGVSVDGFYADWRIYDVALTAEDAQNLAQSAVCARCPAGSTTLAAGAESADACVCQAGAWAPFTPTDAVVAFNPANEAFGASRYHEFGALNFNIATNGFTAVVKFYMKSNSVATHNRIFDFAGRDGTDGSSPDYNIILMRSGNSEALAFEMFNSQGWSAQCTVVSAITYDQWHSVYARYLPSSGVYLTIDDNPTVSDVSDVCKTQVDRTLSTNYIAKSWFTADAQSSVDVAGLYTFNRYLSDAEAKAVLATIQTGALDDPLHTACARCPAGQTTLAAGAESSAACVCQTGSHAETIETCTTCPTGQTTLFPGASRLSECVCESGSFIRDGLVAQFQFDQNLYDAVGSAAITKTTGTTTYINDNTRGYALDMDPGKHYISGGGLGTLLDGQSWTISLWFYSSESSDQNIISRMDEYDSGRTYERGGFYLDYRGSLEKIRFFRLDDESDSHSYTRVQASLSRNVWTHVTAVSSPGYIKLYINGAKISEDGAVGRTWSELNYPTTSNPIQKIGLGAQCHARDTGEEDCRVNENGKGHIQDLRFYNRALSDAEISDLPTNEATVCARCPAGQTTLSAGAESAAACLCQAGGYSNSITYKFDKSVISTLAQWKQFADTIPGSSYDMDEINTNGIWKGSENVGYLQFPIPSYYTSATVTFGNVVDLDGTVSVCVCSSAPSSCSDAGCGSQQDAGSGVSTLTKTFHVVPGQYLRVEETGIAEIKRDLVIVLSGCARCPTGQTTLSAGASRLSECVCESGAYENAVDVSTSASAQFQFDGALTDYIGRQTVQKVAGAEVYASDAEYGNVLDLNQGSFKIVSDSLSDLLDGDSWSVSLWFKPTVSAQTSYLFYRLDITGGTLGTAAYMYSDNRVWIDRYTDSSTYAALKSQILTIGTWYHLVFVSTPTKIELYVDNALSTATGSVTITASWGSVLLTQKEIGIGAKCRDDQTPDCQDSQRHGHLRDLRFYDYTLSAVEISDIYNGLDTTRKGCTSCPPTAPYTDPDRGATSAGECAAAPAGCGVVDVTIAPNPFPIRCSPNKFCVQYDEEANNIFCYGSSSGCLWNTNDCSTDADCVKYDKSSPRYGDDPGHTCYRDIPDNYWHRGACDKYNPLPDLNRLYFSFSDSSTGQTWADSLAWATSVGGRLPTASELKKFLTDTGGVTVVSDMWVAVYLDDGVSKDFLQVATQNTANYKKLSFADTNHNAGSGAGVFQDTSCSGACAYHGYKYAVHDIIAQDVTSRMIQYLHFPLEVYLPNKYTLYFGAATMADVLVVSGSHYRYVTNLPVSGAYTITVSATGESSFLGANSFGVTSGGGNVYSLTYDFTGKYTDTEWQDYAVEIGGSSSFTHFGLFHGWNVVWSGNDNIAYFELPLPAGYDSVTITYGSGGWHWGNPSDFEASYPGQMYVKLCLCSSGGNECSHAACVEKEEIYATKDAGITSTQTMSYTAGQVLRVEEKALTIDMNMIIVLTKYPSIAITGTLATYTAPHVVVKYHAIACPSASDGCTTVAPTTDPAVSAVEVAGVDAGTDKYLPFDIDVSFFLVDSGTFSEVRARCQAAGADLASIRNQDEHNIASTLCKNNIVSSSDYGCYIGLKATGTGQPWYWVDGTRYDYTNWNGGEGGTGGNAGGETVAIIATYVADPAPWSDWGSGDSSFKGICRTSKTDYTVTFSSATTGEALFVSGSTYTHVPTLALPSGTYTVTVAAGESKIVDASGVELAGSAGGSNLLNDGVTNGLIAHWKFDGHTVCASGESGDCLNPYVKVFDGECSGSEIRMFDGNGDNEGTEEERVKACSEACLRRQTALSGSWVDFDLQGFIVAPTNGRCYCEAQDISTCTQVSNVYDRYDWIGDKSCCLINSGVQGFVDATGNYPLRSDGTIFQSAAISGQAVRFMQDTDLIETITPIQIKAGTDGLKDATAATGVTFSMWVKRTRTQAAADGNARDFLFSLGLANENDKLIGATFIQGDKLEFFSFGVVGLTTTETFQDLSSWIFLTFTRSSTKERRIYADGVFLKGDVDSTTLDTTGKLFIGRMNHQDGVTWFNQASRNIIDDFRVYNRVLTDAEITALHQMGTVSAITGTPTAYGTPQVILRYNAKVCPTTDTGGPSCPTDGTFVSGCPCPAETHFGSPGAVVAFNPSSASEESFTRVALNSKNVGETSWPLQTSSGFTLITKFKFTGTGAWFENVAYFGNAAQIGNIWLRRYGSGSEESLDFRIYQGSSGISTDSKCTIQSAAGSAPQNTVLNIIARWDGSVIELDINGVKASADCSLVMQNRVLSETYIGSSFIDTSIGGFVDSSRFLLGDMYGMYAWSRHLSDSETAQVLAGIEIGGPDTLPTLQCLACPSDSTYVPACGCPKDKFLNSNKTQCLSCPPGKLAPKNSTSPDACKAPAARVRFSMSLGGSITASQITEAVKTVYIDRIAARLEIPASRIRIVSVQDARRRLLAVTLQVEIDAGDDEETSALQASQDAVAEEIQNGSTASGLDATVEGTTSSVEDVTNAPSTCCFRTWPDV